MLHYHSNRDVYQTNAPEYEVCNGKNYLHPKYPLHFLVCHSDGRLASKSVLSVDAQRPMSVGKIPDPKSEEFEVGNSKRKLQSQTIPTIV